MTFIGLHQADLMHPIAQLIGTREKRVNAGDRMLSATINVMFAELLNLFLNDEVNDRIWCIDAMFKTIPCERHGNLKHQLLSMSLFKRECSGNHRPMTDQMRLSATGWACCQDGSTPHL